MPLRISSTRNRATASRPRPARAAALCSALLVPALALTACGGGGGATGSGDRDQGVASLRDSGSAAPHASRTPADDPVEAQRPQLRLDTSDEEERRLTVSYWACLEAAGVKMNDDRGEAAAAHGSGGTTQAPPYQSGPNSYKPEAAYKKCRVKMPRQPPELDRDRNPHYADDFHDYVKCLNAGGLKVHELADGSGWTYDSSVPTMSERAATELDKNCMMEAFGGKASGKER